MGEIAKTPQPPYYAVIFTSVRTPGDHGYGKAGEEMMNLVSEQKGFLGAESVRDADGFGMTVSYWDSLESIQAWKVNTAHGNAKEKGRQIWYSEYIIRICKVEEERCFEHF